MQDLTDTAILQDNYEFFDKTWNKGISLTWEQEYVPKTTHGLGI